METRKTSGFTIRLKNPDYRSKTQNVAQKMSVLQRRKSRDHRPFWTAWSAAGISFRHPNFVCKITLWVREIVFCRKEKSQKTAKTATKRHKKKAVIPKNCFVYLNSKIDNSISYQLLAKSHRRFRSTGFHLVSCGQDESLVIRCRCCFFR